MSTPRFPYQRVVLGRYFTVPLLISDPHELWFLRVKGDSHQSLMYLVLVDPTNKVYVRLSFSFRLSVSEHTLQGSRMVCSNFLSWMSLPSSSLTIGRTLFFTHFIYFHTRLFCVYVCVRECVEWCPYRGYSPSFFIIPLSYTGDTTISVRSSQVVDPDNTPSKSFSPERKT